MIEAAARSKSRTTAQCNCYLEVTTWIQEGIDPAHCPPHCHPLVLELPFTRPTLGPLSATSISQVHFFISFEIKLLLVD